MWYTSRVVSKGNLKKINHQLASGYSIYYINIINKHTYVYSFLVENPMIMYRDHTYIMGKPQASMYLLSDSIPIVYYSYLSDKVFSNIWNIFIFISNNCVTPAGSYSIISTISTNQYQYYFINTIIIILLTLILWANVK